MLLAVIGGYIFHWCEYDHEFSQIDEKQVLYDKIKNALNGTYADEFEILLEMQGVPLSHSKNRWRIGPSTFFAFTTASTVGYGYTTPKVKLKYFQYFVESNQ